MSKIVLLFLILCLSANSQDVSPANKKATAQEKALFMNKKHYDAYLERTMKNDAMKKKKELKVFKRKDGTIDTLKTINTANQ